MVFSMTREDFVDLVFDAQEHPRPEAWYQQRSVKITQRVNLIVTMHYIVVFASPGEGKISHTKIQMCRFKIQDPSEFAF
jgi:hypothetical protein